MRWALAEVNLIPHTGNGGKINVSYHVISMWRLYQKTNINSHGLFFFSPSPSQLTLRDGAMQLRSGPTRAIPARMRSAETCNPYLLAEAIPNTICG